METQVGQSSRLSNSPWKQTRCHCKEEINKEVVSLMEAECSCMICEEIFVDVRYPLLNYILQALNLINFTSKLN